MKLQQAPQAGQLINNPAVIQQQQQQGLNIGLIQNNQLINQNQLTDQKDLRHLLVSINLILNCLEC